MAGPLEIAREYNPSPKPSSLLPSGSSWERACAYNLWCIGVKGGLFVVLQEDPQNLSGIVNRGSLKLPITDFLFLLAPPIFFLGGMGSP